jgi:hypothetical protein
MASASAGFSGVVGRLLEIGIGEPFSDRGFAPTDAARADGNLAREGSCLHLPIERRSREAGSVEHGANSKNAIRLI